VEHPPYSTDLDAQSLFSVPEDKGNIERKAFDDIRSNTAADLKDIS
jgi:hypothetical protein